MSNWFSDAIGGFLDGVQDTFKGAGDIIGGVVTLDIEKIGSGFNQMLGGALDTITFGGYSNLVDHLGRALDSAGASPEASYDARKVMGTGSNTPAEIVYGEDRIGGQLVYHESTGTDSQFLWMVVALAPHEVESIGDIYFGDVVAVNNGSSTGTGEFSGLVTAYRLDGTQTTALTDLVNASAGDWTTDHIGEGIAYVVLKLEYDEDAFSRGMPRVSAVVKGKKVYDPRTDTTAWSDNQALILLDYLRLEDGINVADSEIDMASFETAADVADESVAAAGGGTEPRYTVNGTIPLIGNPLDNLESLKDAGASTLLYSQGEFRIVAGKYYAPAVSLDEDDIIGEVDFTTGPDKRAATNTVKGQYLDPRQNYEAVSYPRFSFSELVTRDGEVLETEVSFPFANTPTLARRLAKIMIQKERFGVSVSLTVKYTGSAIDVGDRINLTVERLGWTPKVFRVESATISIGQGISLGLREDGSEVWDWESGEAIDVTPPPAVNLPDRDPIPAPALTLTERVNTPNSVNQDLVTILMEATPPGDARYAYADFSYRIDGTNQWYPIGYSSQNAASVIVPASGATYEVRVRPVSQTGRVWNTNNTDTITVWDRQNEGLPQPERGKLPDIYGLRLLNPVERGNFTQFKSGRAEFAWQPQSQTESKEFSDDTLGVDAGQLDPYFDDYRVRFFVNGTLKFEDFSPGPRYVLSLEDNRRYDIGRSFTIEVVARGANGQLGAPETLDVENPAPEAPVLSVEFGFTSFRLSFTKPEDIDFVGTDLYLITGSGDPFTATPERLSGNSVFRDGLSPGTTYTVGVTAVDQFGDGGQSAPFEFTLPKIDADAIGEITDPITLDEDGGRVITNNSGYVAVLGVHDAGDTNPYVLSANDGLTYPFWVDVAGNASFSGTLDAATMEGGEIIGAEATFGDPNGLHVDINVDNDGRLQAYDADGTTKRIEFGGDGILTIYQDGVSGGFGGTDGLRIQGDRGDGELLNIFHIGTSTLPAADIDGGLYLTNGDLIFEAFDTRRSINRSIKLGGEVHVEQEIAGAELRIDLPTIVNKQYIGDFGVSTIAGRGYPLVNARDADRAYATATDQTMSVYMTAVSDTYVEYVSKLRPYDTTTRTGTVSPKSDYNMSTFALFDDGPGRHTNISFAVHIGSDFTMEVDIQHDDDSNTETGEARLVKVALDTSSSTSNTMLVEDTISSWSVPYDASSLSVNADERHFLWPGLYALQIRYNTASTNNVSSSSAGLRVAGFSLFSADAASVTITPKRG